MIESKENTFLTSPATATFSEGPFRPWQVNNSNSQLKGTN
jgi:hypothetical protein